jgi:flagellar motor switch protein FliG
VDAGPFNFLNGRHPDDVLHLLADEQPQTIAVIAAQLEPSFSAAVLAGMAPDRQAEVLQRIARLGPTDPDILTDIAAAVKDRLGRPRVRRGGVPHAAAVLRESSRSASRAMLASLEDHDSDLADELRQTLFSFDDLLKLDEETLRILQETDDRPWALALKASPEVVRQKVLSCLSERLARALREEMDSLGPIRLSEMTTVRQQIADSIRRLEDDGMIALPVH